MGKIPEDRTAVVLFDKERPLSVRWASVERPLSVRWALPDSCSRSAKLLNKNIYNSQGCVILPRIPLLNFMPTNQPANFENSRDKYTGCTITESGIGSELLRNNHMHDTPYVHRQMDTLYKSSSFQLLYLWGCRLAVRLVWPVSESAKCLKKTKPSPSCLACHLLCEVG